MKRLACISIIIFSGILLEASIPKTPAVSGKDSIMLTDEVLIVVIDKNQMTFNGTYVFKSTFTKDLNAQLTFPFSIDKDHPFPKNISITNMSVTSDNKTLLKLLNDSAIYRMIFKAMDKTSQKVNYTQENKINKAIYLFTANKLEMPLKSLKVYIYVPNIFKDIKISYKTKPPVNKNTNLLYVIDEQNIIPNKNLTIEWK